MATMKMRACAQVGNALSAEDRTALLDRAEKYEASGIEPNTAALMAAGDILAELKAERAEFDGEFKAQHPEQPAAQEQPAAGAAMEGERRDPTKVSMFKPYLSGDIVTIGGKDWMVKQDMPGWYLTSDGTFRGEHPTIKGIKAMQDLIREVEQAAQEQPEAEQQPATKAKKGKAEKAVAEYPLAPAGSRYEETDKPITMMSPDAYLAAVRPLTVDESSRDNIDDLKQHIISGKTLDPLHIRADGKEDGRHRAMAAKELGIKQVPVVDERASAAPKNTGDSGAELAYNKRNRIKGGIKWSDIATKNDALKVKEAVKQNVYPRPDYQALVDGGMQPMVAHLVKQAYDSIAAKPNTRNAPTDADLQTYIAGVNRVMAGVMAWANDPASVSKWASREARSAGAMLGKSVNLSELAPGSGKSMLESVYPDGWKDNRDEVVVLGGNKLLGGLQPSYEEAKRAIKAVGVGWPASQEAWEKRGIKIINAANIDVSYYEGKRSRTEQPYVSISYRAGEQRLWDQLVDGAESKDDPKVRSAVAAELEANTGLFIVMDKSRRILGKQETEEAAKDLARDLTKRESKSGPDDSGIDVALASREGPPRRLDGENVSSDQLREAYGFKGVNFGNWMKGETPALRAERQAHLNHAYDSFADLADLFGVPPKALSLNGMLGLAFGAQGNGQYAAHFVPGLNEINLTRTSGAGSLAHEFGHALDHYFAIQAGFAKREAPFLTEHTTSVNRKLVTENGRQRLVESPEERQIRPELIEHFKAIVQVMNRKAESPEKFAARQAASKEAAKSGVTRWLASIKRDYLRAGVDEAAFDALAGRIQAMDLGDGKIMVSPTLAVNPVVDDLRALYRKKAGRVPPIDQIKGLQANIDHMAYVLSERPGAVDHVPQQVSSDYAIAAAAMDKEKGGRRYWSTNLEMFARAFDAFVSDSLAEKAASNTYLSHAGRTGETVPMGDERTAINAAIKALVGEIKTRDGDNGNVAMFSRKEASLGIPMRDAQAVADAIRAAYPTGPQIVVLDDVGKAPEALLDQIRAVQAANTVEGAYYKGKIYLFPQNVADIQRLMFVGAHHEIRHAGLDALFGKRKGALLLSIAMSNPKVADAARKKMADDLADSMVAATEEALADMPLEDMAKLNGWNKIVAAVRQWLRDMAARLKRNHPKLAAMIEPDQWTDNDVAALIRRAEDISRGGTVPARPGGAVFSREPGVRAALDRALAAKEAFDAYDRKAVQVENADEFFALSEKATDARDALAAKLLAQPDDAFALQGRTSRGRMVIVNGSAQNPGQWQLTRFDGNDEPWGDSQYRTKESALADFLREIDLTTLQDMDGAFSRADQTQTPASGAVFSRAGTAKTTAQDLVNSTGGVFDFNRLGETKQDRLRTIMDAGRPGWLGLLTRDQIADVYGQDIAPVKEYDQLTREMENQRSKIAQDADDLYNEWAKLPAETNDKLARLMLDATVYSVHPDAPFAKLDRPDDAERQKVHVRLKAQYALMGKEGQAIYGKVRDFHKGTLEQLRDALEARVTRQVENGQAKAAALTKIRQAFDAYLKEGPYFPLSRFGDFIVVGTRESDGERVVASYATAGEQAAAARTLEADGFTVKMKTAKTYSRETDGSAGKFIGDVLTTIGNLDMLDATVGGNVADLKTKLMDDVNQLFIKALPDLSYRRHFMHRKGTPGFSSDMMRGFASSAFHAASHIARLNHGDRMTFALQDAFTAIEQAPDGDFNLHSQVLNELTKRHDAALNPNTHPVAAMLNQVGFVMYLGLSPAAGLINMLQTVMVTMPHLGARYGFGKANASLATALTDITTGAKANAKNGWNAAQSTKLTAAERTMMSELQDEGVIDLTQAHDLSAATGLDTGNVARSKAAFAMARAMKIVGWTFHIPEVMNRQVTALSAYRLEMEKTGDAEKAKDAAREAIKRTHFDYSSSNRARFMQGNVARVLLQFKQYSQNMTYLLGRAAYQALKDESPEVRSIARRQLVATFGVTWAMAGALGLPGLGTVAGLIGMLAGAMDDDDEPYDWKVEFRNLLADNFGKEAGEVLSHGIPRALLPWDISNRVSLGDLWFRDSGREGQSPREAFATDAANILGPTAGTVLGLYTAADHMARGNWSKAAESVLPKFLRDPLKAIREGSDGVTSYNGEPLMDLTGAEVTGRLLGFAPARASEMYEGKAAVMNAKTAIEEKRQSLISRMAKARIDKDADTAAELQPEIAAFNQRNPEFRITGATLAKAIMTRMKNRQNTDAGILLPRTKDSLRDIGRFAEVD